jgi:hypothetical protein
MRSRLSRHRAYRAVAHVVGRGRARRAAATLCSLGAGVLLAAPAALAGSCPNAASRQGPSVNLPDCRVYEQVTPVNKGDAIDLFGNEEFEPKFGERAYVAEDGSAILLKLVSSIGPNAPTFNTSYVSSRGAGGWSMSALASPTHQPQQVDARAGSVFDPADLSRVSFQVEGGTYANLNAGDEAAYQTTNLIGPVGGPYTTLSSVNGFAGLPDGSGKVNVVGGSEDLSHVVLESPDHSLAPGAAGQDEGSSALYESFDGRLRLVNLSSEGSLLSPCGASLGQGERGSGGARSAVSNDGSKVIFTAPDPNLGYMGGLSGSTGPGCWNPNTAPQENTPQLYIRENATRTVEVSAPEAGVAVGTAENPVLLAVFVGASADGSKVFFLTRTELTKDDTTHAVELYEYETATGKLTRISHGGSGTAEGNVDFVAAVSQDGSAVYFSAFGKLAAGATALKREQALSPVNLYRYDTLTGATTYVATLNTNGYPQKRGSLIRTGWYITELEGGPFANGRGTEENGLSSRKEWYTTADGRYLVFDTISPLTGFDNNMAPDITAPGVSQCNYYEPPVNLCQELYRYDAATGSLVCVSCVGGAPIDGANFTRAALVSPASGPPRPISEDGKYVFFDSANALVAQAVPGRIHVYEWHDGVLSMISPPGDPASAFFLGSSADGSNVFFSTHAQLASADTDVSTDVYDARIGGGFAGLVAAQCTGTGCQGVPGAPPIFATPASVTFEGVGNFPAVKPVVKPKTKAKRCGRGFVKRHGRCVKSKRAKKSAKGRK